MHPGKEKHLAVGHYDLAGRDAALHNHSAIDRPSDGHRARFHSLIGLDYIDEWPFLAGLNRLRGDDGCIAGAVQGKDDVNELPGPEHAVGIVKGGFQMNSSGLRVYSIVDDT